MVSKCQLIESNLDAFTVAGGYTFTFVLEGKLFFVLLEILF